MELISLNLKNYKKAYITATVINLVSIIISLVLVKMGYRILPPFYATQKVSRPVILLLIAGSFWVGWRYKKRIAQLDGIERFEDKVAKHEKIYYERVIWGAINCCSSSLLYLLTGHAVFLYLAMFDFVMYLLAFPNKLVIKQELKNEEIIFL